MAGEAPGKSRQLALFVACYGWAPGLLSGGLDYETYYGLWLCRGEASDYRAGVVMQGVMGADWKNAPDARIARAMSDDDGEAEAVLSRWKAWCSDRADIERSFAAEEK